MASAERKVLSSRLTSMKFMTRKEETKRTEVLAAERDSATLAMKWSAPVQSAQPQAPAAAGDLGSIAVAESAPGKPAPTAVAAADRRPAVTAEDQAAGKKARTARQSLVIHSDDEDVTLSFTGAGAGGAGAAAAAAAPVQFGRRSYGSFNQQIERLKREVTEGSAARATDLTDEELVRAFSERQGGGSGSSLLRSGPSGKHRGGSDRGGGGGGGGSGFGKGGKGGKGSWQHDAAGTGKQRHRSRNQNSDSEDSG